MKKYVVHVAGQPFEIALIRNGKQFWAEVDGRRVRVGLRPQAGRALHTLIWAEQALTLYIEGRGSGYRIQLSGRVYEIEVERSAIHALKRHLKARAAALSEGVEVRAHMPGLITKVEVTRGQRVDAGAGLFVIEAMKMENELRAPCAGIVEEVSVSESHEVKSGERLCVIRPSAA